MHAAPTSLTLYACVELGDRETSGPGECSVKDFVPKRLRQEKISAILPRDRLGKASQLESVVSEANLLSPPQVPSTITNLHLSAPIHIRSRHLSGCSRGKFASRYRALDDFRGPLGPIGTDANLFPRAAAFPPSAGQPGLPSRPSLAAPSGHPLSAPPAGRALPPPSAMARFTR